MWQAAIVVQVLTDLQKMVSGENPVRTGKRGFSTVFACTYQLALVADGADGAGQYALHRSDAAAEGKFGHEFIAIKG